MELYILASIFTAITTFGFYYPVPFTNIRPDSSLRARLFGALQLTVSAECTAWLYNYFTTPQYDDSHASVLEINSTISEAPSIIHEDPLEESRQDTADNLPGFQSSTETVTIHVTPTLTSNNETTQAPIPVLYKFRVNIGWVLYTWVAFAPLFAFCTWWIASHMNLEAREFKDAQFAMLNELIEDLKHKTAPRLVVDDLASKAGVFDYKLQVLKSQMDQLLKTAHSGATTGLGMDFSGNKALGLRAKAASKGDIDELHVRSAEIMAMVNSQDKKVQGLQDSIHSLQTAFEAKGKKTNDPPMDLKGLHTQQAGEHINALQTSAATQKILSEVGRQVVSSEARIDQIVQDFTELKKKNDKDSKWAFTLNQAVMDQTDELQAKVASAEVRIQGLVKDIEISMPVDDTADAGRSMEELDDQMAELRNKVESYRKLTDRLAKDLVDFKKMAPGQDTQELQGKLKSHEVTLERFFGDMTALKDIMRDSSSQTNQLQNRIDSCEAALEQLTKSLTTVKDGRLKDKSLETELRFKVIKLGKTLGDIDTFAMTTRSDVDRISVRVKEVESLTQTCHKVLAQQGNEILNLHGKLNITAPVTSLIDNEDDMAQKSTERRSAGKLVPKSSRREPARTSLNVPSPTSILLKSNRSPSTTLSGAKLESVSRWDLVSNGEETIGLNSEPASKSHASPSLSLLPPLLSAPSTPISKAKALSKRPEKSLNRGAPAYKESDASYKAERKEGKASPSELSQKDGTTRKEQGDIKSKKTASFSGAPPSSPTSSRSTSKLVAKTLVIGSPLP
ncbi:hypothetical protein AJ79_02617 [Helicocarpus griseus UAMH5409]|uniref:Uncharacterized protein n=1 Tax=Helicocarpus griseus UAMH5409 TaxID=1447875 RepID=A0A2B7Y220_9EURO|nr:hypothetical protein AJ79_02617 [Helicocarpus griseus UAMH5409]